MTLNPAAQTTVAWGRSLCVHFVKGARDSSRLAQEQDHSFSDRESVRKLTVPQNYAYTQRSAK